MGAFTTLLNKREIGAVMSFYGIAEVVGGRLWGRSVDIFERRTVLAIGTLIYCAAVAAALGMRIGIFEAGLFVCFFFSFSQVYLKYNMKNLTLLYSIIFIFRFLCTLLKKDPINPYLPYFLAFLLGLGDSLFNVMYLSTTGSAFQMRDRVTAYAFNQVIFFSFFFFVQGLIFLNLFYFYE